jgi:hypothetical protein
MNGDQFNNCRLKGDLLACKNFDFLKTHWTQLTLPVWRAGHNRFSVVAEHNSFLTCKIVATVSPGEGYPELPDLSDNPLPYCIFD